MSKTRNVYSGKRISRRFDDGVNETREIFIFKTFPPSLARCSTKSTPFDLQMALADGKFVQVKSMSVKVLLFTMHGFNKAQTSEAIANGVYASRL